ncbi:MAG: hypothetical protein QM708_10030 [Propioniciclava sp.]|uniref:hypothetical protein n=1 Tax=Propioniciclava sp. TaxID=2038686 RepID=UPI0039E2167E
MADKLTSVRFDSNTLDKLRLLASLHEDSTASEIRKAVAAYIERETSSEDFHTKVERKQEKLRREHDELAEKLLARRPTLPSK